MYSLSTSYSPSKQRISPPSSPEGSRPNYSILCDETRALMLAFLRKISNVLQHNEHLIEERNSLSEEQKQKEIQTTQSISTNICELSKRIFFNIFYQDPQLLMTRNVHLKPLLPTEVLHQLTNTKNKFSELFQVRSCI